MLGPSTLQSIHDGKKFATIDGGKHLDLSELISYTASIFSIIDYSIRGYNYALSKVRSSEKPSEIEEVKKQVVAELQKDSLLEEVKILESETNLFELIIEEYLNEDKV